MAKRARQDAILEVIRTHRVGSQGALKTLLDARGFEVTQATLSRDIRELRLVKAPAADGQAHYTFPEEWESTPPLERILPTLFVSAEGTGNLIVVRTLTGGAQAVGLGFDGQDWPEVLGTLAGDDTILLVLRTPEQAGMVKRRIEAIAGRRP